ncbi:MAG: MoaD/ThiS family protein [Planctomycetota bacterium]
MNVRVLLFAGAREAAGADAVQVDVPADADYARLAEAMAAQQPALSELIGRSRFAEGTRYVAPGDTIDPSTEIALIPPVSGG